MKFLFVVLSIIFFTPSWVNAQDGEDFMMQHLEIIGQYQVESVTRTQVRQSICFGDFSDNLLNDVNSNVVSIEQERTSNSVYISQIGNGHTSISKQFGVNNEANLWSEGFNTQNVVIQMGDNNFINQFVENYYSVTRSVVAMQVGNDNKIELAMLNMGESTNFLGAMITQTGNANSVELVLNQSDASYFKINQSGGAEIKVTQTDFYFPMK